MYLTESETKLTEPNRKVKNNRMDTKFITERTETEWIITEIFWVTEICWVTENIRNINIFLKILVISILNN